MRGFTRPSPTPPKNHDGCLTITVASIASSESRVPQFPRKILVGFRNGFQSTYGHLWRIQTAAPGDLIQVQSKVHAVVLFLRGEMDCRNQPCQAWRYGIVQSSPFVIERSLLISGGNSCPHW